MVHFANAVICLSNSCVSEDAQSRLKMRQTSLHHIGRICYRTRAWQLEKLLRMEDHWEQWSRKNLCVATAQARSVLGAQRWHIMLLYKRSKVDRNTIRRELPNINDTWQTLFILQRTIHLHTVQLVESRLSDSNIPSLHIQRQTVISVYSSGISWSWWPGFMWNSSALLAS